MKKCPHCGERIQDVAKKCRFCGEWIENSSNTKVKFLILEKKLLKFVCIMLGIAIIRFGGYWFYLLNRLVIFIVMIFLGIKHYKFNSKNENTLWLYGITAFVYNPIFSIYLTRPIRTVIDITLILIFVYSIRSDKDSSIKN